MACIKSKILIQMIMFLGMMNLSHSMAQTIYPKGVYLSVEELRTRLPSFDPAVEIEKRSVADKAMMGGNDFKIISTEDGIGKRQIKTDWIGYSDGQTLYLNGFPFEIQTWYCKVESEGALLLFYGGMKTNDAAAVAVVGGAIGSAAAANVNRLYVLDLKTMKVQQSDKKLCSTYLQAYPAILEEFNEEHEKGAADVQLNYLKRLNEVANDTIAEGNLEYLMESINAKPVYLVVYRRSRKEVDEPISLVIQDSSSFVAVPDSYWWNKYSTSDSRLNICWQDSATHQCEEIDVTAGGTYYVAVSKDEKSQVSSIKLVDSGEGEWDSELARKAQLKREK